MSANVVSEQKIGEWVSNYIQIQLWDIITHPWDNFNGRLTKWPLKFDIYMINFIPQKEKFVIT